MSSFKNQRDSILADMTYTMQLDKIIEEKTKKGITSAGISFFQLTNQYVPCLVSHVNLYGQSVKACFYRKSCGQRQRVTMSCFLFLRLKRKQAKFLYFIGRFLFQKIKQNFLLLSLQLSLFFYCYKCITFKGLRLLSIHMVTQKTECRVFNKRDMPSCESCIWDIKIRNFYSYVVLYQMAESMIQKS